MLLYGGLAVVLLSELEMRDVNYHRLALAFNFAKDCVEWSLRFRVACWVGGMSDRPTEAGEPHGPPPVVCWHWSGSEVWPDVQLDTALCGILSSSSSVFGRDDDKALLRGPENEMRTDPGVEFVIRLADFLRKNLTIWKPFRALYCMLTKMAHLKTPRNARRTYRMRKRGNFVQQGQGNIEINEEDLLNLPSLDETSCWRAVSQRYSYYSQNACWLLALQLILPYGMHTQCWLFVFS